MSSENKSKNIGVRVIYILICIVLFMVALYFSKTILSCQDYLNKISYWGTVATLISLFVAIGEIIHAIKTTRHIQDRIEDSIKNITNHGNAINSRDCIAQVDEIIQQIDDEDYKLASYAFKQFKKTHKEFIKSAEYLNDLEHSLMRFAKAAGPAAISKPQKNLILKNLIKFKDSIETPPAIERN